MVFVRSLLATALAILLPGGCTSSGELPAQGRSPSTLKEFLLKHEATFDPLRYEPDIAWLKNASALGVLEIGTVAITALPETTAGFRVQILFTQDIDQATQLRDSLDSLFPDQWVYTVYDAPYYKVRVGNHDDRQTAAQIVKRLTSFGFKDAWIVPDNIFRNVPPKPPTGDIEAIPRLQALH